MEYIKNIVRFFSSPSHLTCVLQARRGVRWWGEAERPGLECRRHLVAYALGPLPALDGQTSPAGLVAVDPAGCAGEGWRCREAVGRERPWRSKTGECAPPRGGTRFAAGQRERDRVKQGERCGQKGGGERRSSR